MTAQLSGDYYRFFWRLEVTPEKKIKTKVNMKAIIVTLIPILVSIIFIIVSMKPNKAPHEPGRSDKPGCTNPLSENYDSNATIDDGTCHSGFVKFENHVCYATESMGRKKRSDAEVECSSDPKCKGIVFENEMALMNGGDTLKVMDANSCKHDFDVQSIFLGKKPTTCPADREDTENLCRTVPVTNCAENTCDEKDTCLVHPIYSNVNMCIPKEAAESEKKFCFNGGKLVSIGPLRYCVCNPGNTYDGTAWGGERCELKCPFFHDKGDTLPPSQRFEYIRPVDVFGNTNETYTSVLKDTNVVGNSVQVCGNQITSESLITRGYCVPSGFENIGQCSCRSPGDEESGCRELLCNKNTMGNIQCGLNSDDDSLGSCQFALITDSPDPARDVARKCSCGGAFRYINKTSIELDDEKTWYEFETDPNTGMCIDPCRDGRSVCAGSIEDPNYDPRTTPTSVCTIDTTGDVHTSVCSCDATKKGSLCQFDNTCPFSSCADCRPGTLDGSSCVDNSQYAYSFGEQNCSNCYQCGESDVSSYPVPAQQSSDSCEIVGCTDESATSYNPAANVHQEASCWYNGSCNNPYAFNYDPQGASPGSCRFSKCIDPLARNYCGEDNNKRNGCCSEPSALCPYANITSVAEEYNKECIYSRKMRIHMPGQYAAGNHGAGACWSGKLTIYGTNDSRIAGLLNAKECCNPEMYRETCANEQPTVTKAARTMGLHKLFEIADTTNYGSGPYIWDSGMVSNTEYLVIPETPNFWADDQCEALTGANALPFVYNAAEYWRALRFTDISVELHDSDDFSDESPIKPYPNRVVSPSYISSSAVATNNWCAKTYIFEIPNSLYALKHILIKCRKQVRLVRYLNQCGSQCNGAPDCNPVCDTRLSYQHEPVVDMGTQAISCEPECFTRGCNIFRQNCINHFTGACTNPKCRGCGACAWILPLYEDDPDDLPEGHRRLALSQFATYPMATPEQCNPWPPPYGAVRSTSLEPCPETMGTRCRKETSSAQVTF